MKKSLKSGKRCQVVLRNIIKDKIIKIFKKVLDKMKKVVIINIVSFFITNFKINKLSIEH